MDDGYFNLIIILVVMLIVIFGAAGILTTKSNEYRKEHYKCPEGSVESYSRDTGYICTFPSIKIK